MNISVVIPVYNSEHTLENLVHQLEDALGKSGHHFEVILVDDGSRDRSVEIITGLAKKYSWINGVFLSRNYGQHNALLCGIREARFEAVVTLDDDLQFPPQEIHKLLERFQEGYDVVYGVPENERHQASRRISSFLMKWIMEKVMKIPMSGKLSAFRAFRTSLRDSFANFHSPYISVDVLLTWGTTRFSWVSVTHQPREKGKSNYTWRALLRHTLNMTVGLSTWPLRVTTILGFCLAGFGGGVLVYVISRYFILGGSVPGFPFLASIVSIFSGVQLFSIGVLGEYIAYIYTFTVQKPGYTIRSKTRPSDSLHG